MKTIILFALGLILLGCSTESKKESTQQEGIMDSSDTEKYESLKSVLDEKKNAFLSNAPEEKIQVYNEGIKAVENSGILESAKNIGDKAPNFTLTNAFGDTVSLNSYLKKGPVILTWYRGGWCPYCNLTMHRMQRELVNFKDLGANMIALTPELPDSSLNTKEKLSLEFEVLSDIGNKIANDYGIVYDLSKEVAASYQKGFDLHSYNGDESNQLPLAATYVIDQNGIIQFAFLDAEYRNRAEPSEIIKALKEINKP